MEGCPPWHSVSSHQVGQNRAHPSIHALRRGNLLLEVFPYDLSGKAERFRQQ